MLQICLNLQIQTTAYGGQSGKLWSQQLALRTSQSVLQSEHRLTKRLKKELLSIHEVKTERNSIAIAILKKISHLAADLKNILKQNYEDFSPLQTGSTHNLTSVDDSWVVKGFCSISTRHANDPQNRLAMKETPNTAAVIEEVFTLSYSSLYFHIIFPVLPKKTLSCIPEWILSYFPISSFFRKFYIFEIVRNILSRFSAKNFLSLIWSPKSARDEKTRRKSFQWIMQ